MFICEKRNEGGREGRRGLYTLKGGTKIEVRGI
jgi:hypothetical protein